MNRTQVPPRRVPHQHERGQRKGQKRAEKDDLERCVEGAQKLDDDVMRRKDREGRKGKKHTFDVG